MVTFEYLNLAEDCYPSPLNNTNAMDVIFCRNVLMYFAPARITPIAQSLHHCMMEGGWLVVGSSELSQQLFPQFECATFPNAMVYRKRDRRLATEDRLPSSVLHPPSPVPRPPSPVLTTPPAARTERKETEPEAPNVGAQSVRALANQGRLADALALCAKTIATGKLDAGLHYLHAMILQEMNQDGEATASLRRALYLDPDFVPAHFAMGNLALRLGDRRTGRRSMENVQTLLAERREEDILTEFEGLTVGRFREIVRATLQIGGFA
jgi:chemotaxis protein methyltransferase CheR